MKIALGAVLTMALVSSCQAQVTKAALPAQTEQPGQPAADPESLSTLLQAKWPETVFHVDDVISAEVYGIKDYAVKQQVTQDGSVRFPLVGKVQAAGLTADQLADALASELSKSGMVHDPQVTITAVARPSMVVTVSGDVAKPGVFPAYANRTLMDYLSEAGGLQNNLPGNSPINSPSSSTVTLVRPGLAKPVRVPLGSSLADSPYARIPILPGDEIRVGRVGVVYAVGAFKLQGSFPLKNTGPTTVLQLAALAGGIGYEGDRKDAHIIRTQGDSRYVVDVDVNKILNGKAGDVALQPDDILFVPTNSMKAALKGGGSGVLVSLASAYLYSHP